MGKSIYLINPKPDTPSYYGAECIAGWGLPPTVSMADLALPSVAALAPPDFDIILCEERVQPVQYDLPVDYVAITGKAGQGRRMATLAEAFRKRGRTVLIGGPYASLEPDLFRSSCDVLVVGEIENIAPAFFADLASASWKPEYRGDKPDLSACRTPRWDLYPNEQCLSGMVQTSRGCPFECEFCDVIQYLGRAQRHKSIPQVLAELDVVYRHGYRQIYLADDNFTVYRHRVKELLLALEHWNRAQETPVKFYTQVSIDAAKDDELLSMCARAGLTHVFIGIETPNVESLKETKKRQNVNVDLRERVESFVRHGISVDGGMIVGFDADGADVFDIQFEFAMSLPIAVFTCSPLSAPAATPLYARLAQAGRLLPVEWSGGQALPWHTNIVPNRMSHQELLDGTQRLCNRLYAPEAFFQRVARFIDLLGPRTDPGATARPKERPREANRRVFELLTKLREMGPKEARMWTELAAKLATKPSARDIVAQMLFQYMQVRHMYEVCSIWDHGDAIDDRIAEIPVQEAL